MGFVAGFAGGVTLTLSLTYLALLTHARNRQAQSAVLRAQTSTLDALVPPDPSSSYPRRRNASAVLPDGTYRPRESLEHYHPSPSSAASPVSSLVESAKTRWNEEVLSAVRWAQGKDWAAVRERAEAGAARLLGVELPRELPDAGATGGQLVGAVGGVDGDGGRQQEQQQQQQQQQQKQLDERRVSEALHHARDRTVIVAQAMRDEAKEVVAEARQVVSAGVEEARGVVSKRVEDARDAVSRGVEKAHDFVERTKAAVHLAEGRAEAKADAKLLHLSDIEKALAERYDSARREERMRRSAEEVLRERYIPLEQRDNSRLRGI